VKKLKRLRNAGAHPDIGLVDTIRAALNQTESLEFGEEGSSSAESELSTICSSLNPLAGPFVPSVVSPIIDQGFEGAACCDHPLGLPLDAG